MKNPEDKQKFFEEVKYDLEEVNVPRLFQMIKDSVINNDVDAFNYEKIISYGAENQGKRVEKQDMRKLLTKFYDIWWHNWLIPKSKMSNCYPKDRIEYFANQKEFNPDSKYRLEDILEIIDEMDIQNLLEDSCRFQGDHFLIFDTSFFTADREHYARQFYEAKLYLNINLTNRPKLAEKLINKAILKDIPLVFKFAFDDERTDNFVMYANFIDMKKTIDMVEEVKRENPSLFEGSKIYNPLVAKYKEYIGVGEESIYGSYNSARCDILNETRNELAKEYSLNKYYLKNENIKKVFDKWCFRLRIDPDNFCQNMSEEKYKEYYEIYRENYK